GKISEEDLRARLNGMRRAMADQGERSSRRITREDYARAEAGLKKAVAEGKISEEDLRARLNGMRRAMADQGKRGGDGDREFDMEGFLKRIRAAVEHGDMTREKAGKMIDGARRRMEMRERHDDEDPDARGRTRSEVDWDGIRRRIEGAVERGEMTREQAAGRIEAY
ncbi:unnamed protein product, partial [marine sediment metagenome]